MIKINCLMCIIFVFLQYSLWLGKNGVYDFIYIYYKYNLYKKNNDISQLRTRNNQLLIEVHDLIYGCESIEELARYDLGMIKFGEIFYHKEFDY